MCSLRLKTELFRLIQLKISLDSGCPARGLICRLLQF